MQEQLSTSAPEEQSPFLETQKGLDFKPAADSVSSLDSGLVDASAVASGTDSCTDSSSVSSKSSSIDLSVDAFRAEPLPSHVSSFTLPENQSDSILLLKRDGGDNDVHQSLTNSSPGTDDTSEDKDKRSNVTIDDLSKQVKIANSNLQACEVPPNNQLAFNSSKFLKCNELRKQDVVENLRTDLSLSDTATNFKLQHNSLKRSKATNVTSGGQVFDVTSASGPMGHRYASFTQTSPVTATPDCKRIKTSESETAETSTVSPTEVLMAEISDSGIEEWNKYLTRNRSVIVDTFHGQFKSTVKCSKCAHVSVTFEPFMYLPVPLPHALEKQVIITFVSASNFTYGSRSSAPVRYLIDIHKYDRVSKVIAELRAVLRSQKVVPDESSKITIAEVKNSAVHRVLDEGMLLRFVDDQNLFAYELPPVPSLAPSSDSLSLKDDATPPDSNDMDAGHHFDSADHLSDPFQAGDQYDLEGLELTHLSPNVSPIKTTDSSEQGWPCSQDSGIEDDHKDSVIPLIFELPVSEPFDRTQAFVAQTTQNTANIAPVDDFVPCCVCLERKAKEELVEHPSPCSCIICTFCLDRHHEVNPINQTDRFHCPTCNKECTKSDFTPMEKPYLPSPAKNMIVPVVFRMRETTDADRWNADKFRMLSHPVLIQLPSQLTCAQLYESVEPFVPLPLPFTLLYVNSTGQRCSRCSERLLKSEDCTGCEIARMGSVSLTYSDAIAVQFDSTSNEKEQLDSATDAAIVDHDSMSRKRPIKVLKLEECIQQFHESEDLDDENNWFCPSCRCNQRAHKSLTIWRSPPVLMVYLKRFIFHEMMPIKIDDPVAYPMHLNLSEALPKQTGDHCLYDLEAIVCHCGGVSAGHYTAYAKHCISQKWMYCNDGNVTGQDPCLNDERAYVLFYRRSGTNVDLSTILAPSPDRSDGDEESGSTHGLKASV